LKYPLADTTLTLREAYTNQAATHHKTTLWLLLVSSALFAIGGGLLALVARDASGRLAGWSGMFLFGLCATAFGFMLAKKR